MKVKIGPYQNYNKKTGKTPKRIIDIKIDKFDTWNMDSTLAYIIVPMLKQLKKTKHGSPCIDMEDAPAKLRSDHAYDQVTHNTDKFFHKRWDWVLNEMIWAFEQVNNDNAESKFWSGKTDWYHQLYDKNKNKIGKPIKLFSKQKKKLSEYEYAYSELVKGPKHTIVHHEKEHRAYENRKKNGFRLFGKYFGCLWD